jgi:hypothetical protein
VKLQKYPELHPNFIFSKFPIDADQGEGGKNKELEQMPELLLPLPDFLENSIAVSTVPNREIYFLLIN